MVNGLKDGYDIDINTSLNPSFGMSDGGFIEHTKGDYELLSDISVQESLSRISNN